MHSQQHTVTVTFNPAIDLTGSVADFASGKVNRVTNAHSRAAGKGINVAKVLRDLGSQVTVSGFLGRENDTPFTQFFEQNQFEQAFVSVEGQTRSNIKLVDNDSTVTDINFAGFTVTEDNIDQLEQQLLALAEHYDQFVFAGSLPQNLAPEIVAEWITMLRQQGKKVALDSSQAMLQAGVSCSPWLIKPNEHELSQLLGCELTTVAQCIEALPKLEQYNIEHVLISMGAEGVLWHNQGQTLLAVPPKVSVASTVGAGDSLVAGFVWAQQQMQSAGWSKQQVLSFATAVGAHAVTQTNVGIDDVDAVHKLQLQVSVELIN